MPQPDFGARLRAAREARGVTLRAIADRTKISLSVLEALEHGDVSRLPGGIFSRSFIRAYASEVGLDPEATVQEFLQRFPDPVVPLRDVIQVPEAPARRRGWPRGLTASLVLVTAAVVGVALMGWPQALQKSTESLGPLPEVPAAPVDVARPFDIAPMPGTLDPADESGAGDPATASARGPSAVGAGLTRSLTVDAGSGEPLRLVLAPTDRCWIKVVADGEVVLSRELAPGERIGLEARLGFVVTVGDAGAFAYAINDVPGRPLGPRGRVVTVRIERANLTDFVAG